MSRLGPVGIPLTFASDAPGSYLALTRHQLDLWSVFRNAFSVPVGFLHKIYSVRSKRLLIRGIVFLDYFKIGISLSVLCVLNVGMLDEYSVYIISKSMLAL